MKRVKVFIFFYLIGFFPSISTYFLVTTPDISNHATFHLQNENSVSKYENPQNVTYKIETSLVLQNSIELGDYYFKNARVDNRTFDSQLTPRVPPYQISNCESLNINGNTTSIQFQQDRFNNTYDSFNSTSLNEGSEITIDYEYEVTLNEILFDNITENDIGEYDQSEKIFDLYCNKSVEYFNTSDPDLINRADSIVDSGDNPVEKAEKIFDWIIENIEYDETLDEEKGATYAYANRTGDCSEFSDLMVTLLRIQGIPARKVTGFVLTNNPLTELEEEQEWNYDLSYDSNSQTISSDNPYLGHAWIEYYVPQVGWIACDPTWGVQAEEQEEMDYFNRIDYLHFGTTVGSHIPYPPGENCSEFPFLPEPVVLIGGSEYLYEVNTKITILETNLSLSDREPELWMIVLSIILVSAIIAGIIGTIVIIIKKVYKNDERHEVNTSERSYM
ncbi:MAG: transglutaminase-like domain-containing protein [Promethearchaeia archaeon]